MISSTIVAVSIGSCVGILIQDPIKNKLKKHCEKRWEDVDIDNCVACSAGIVGLCAFGFYSLAALGYSLLGV